MEKTRFERGRAVRYTDRYHLPDMERYDSQGIQKIQGPKKENLRDNMTNKELVLNMLAELSTKEISESRKSSTFDEHGQVAKSGGEIARNARMELEAKTGKKVISPLNAKKSLLLNQKSDEIIEDQDKTE